MNEEIETLKRELAICAKDRDNFRSASENASRNYVALSASYQRQKDALQRLYNYQAQRSSPDTAWDEPMMRNARTALAETPDVSLLERYQYLATVAKEVVEADDAAIAEIEAMGVKPETRLTSKLKYALNALLSTLQPDHQKS